MGSDLIRASHSGSGQTHINRNILLRSFLKLDVQRTQGNRAWLARDYYSRVVPGVKKIDAHSSINSHQLVFLELDPVDGVGVGVLVEAVLPLINAATLSDSALLLTT